MIESTANKPLSTTNHIKQNTTTNPLSYQEKTQLLQQERSQNTSEQVHLKYSSESITTYDQSMSLESHTGSRYDLLRGLVLNIFKEQGLDYTIATEDTDIDLSTISPDEAQELIADEGYFGAEKTAERIFTFAVGVAGNDPARIDAIREGIEHGFQEALDAFSGRLPYISYNTYDTVMKKLDDWATVTNSPQSQALVKS